MDLINRVKDKLGADKASALQDWYKWCDETGAKYAAQVRGKLAFELGHIPEPLQAAIKEAFVAGLREAGRHIVTTKLVDAVKQDPPPADSNRGHGYGHETGPGPDSPYTPDGVFGEGGEPK